MTKKIYTLLAFAVLSTSLMAQTKSATKFGIKAGVNFAKFAMSGSGEAMLAKNYIDPITSFQIGGYAAIPLGNTVTLQPGLTLSGKGSALKFTTSDFDEETNTQYSNTIEVETNLMYLELPVNFVANIKGFYFGAGPYLGYGIAGKDKTTLTSRFGSNVESETAEEDVQFGNREDMVKPLDFGLNALVGYQLKNGINLGVNYGLGLAKTNNNDSTGDDTNFSNRVFSVLIGFSF